MTSKTDVLVVGGGPAGVAAACRIAEAGYTVQLCDQAPAPGGAIFRGAADSSPIMPAEHKATWREISARLDHHAAAIQVMTSTSFIGLDSNGIAVLKDCNTGQALQTSPRGVVLATGAIESVRPVPGWHLPRVVTAGGLQVSIKSSGEPPDGDIIIAGNGPLLPAIAAQLSILGNPPIAVVESAKPMLPRAQLLGLPLAYVREALSYVRTLRRFRVPWIQGAHIERIERHDERLSVAIRKGTRELLYTADIVGLHNGLQCNSTGLPDENTEADKGVIVIRAGDCHEPLGARAAPASGQFAADQLLAALQQSGTRPAPPAQLRRQARAQASLKSIFKPVSGIPLQSLPDDTVLCRCEQKTVGDLRHLLVRPEVSAKEIKLNGRFGMGRCQGRFCAKWTLDLVSEIAGVSYPLESLTGNRWPIRPISIGAIANLALDTSARQPADSETH